MMNENDLNSPQIEYIEKTLENMTVQATMLTDVASSFHAGIEQMSARIQILKSLIETLEEKNQMLREVNYRLTNELERRNK